MDDSEYIAQAAFRDVLSLDVRECKVYVFIASFTTDEKVPVFQRLQLASGLTDEFRAVVAGCLKLWGAEDETQQPVLWPHLDGTRPDAFEFEHLDLAQHDQIRAQVKGLAVPAIDIPVFTADNDVVSGIRFYVVTVQPPSAEPVHFFRTYTPKRELSRSHWFAALLHDGQFDHADTPTFLFDNHIDCFSVGNLLFVVQKTNFRAIFRFLERVALEAEKTLSLIRDRIPIKNFEQFAEDCRGHIHKIAKLNNIARQPYLATITMDDIRNVLRQVPSLKIRIENVGGIEMLVYDRGDRWAILQLLGNHFMQSLLTKGIFNANSSRPVAEAESNGRENGN